MSGGRVRRVNGPIVEVDGLQAAMLDLVEVGSNRLPGEVISLAVDGAIVQVYEYTGGVRPGDTVDGAGTPLTVELGPGLIGGVFDGLLRRLIDAPELLQPGTAAATLPAEQRFPFTPDAAPGTLVEGGATLGRVRESTAVELHAMVPAGVRGELEWLAPEGSYTAWERIAVVGGQDVPLARRWPVRRPLPVRERLPATRPLVTGQRVIDLLFPIALGSSGAIPGGFGTGKTVLLQQIAKWCDADVIVYVGCGERGNEMADVLHELRQLQDPRNGEPLLDRTVLIANTSNMPVLAREASIYTAVTVAEFYRDMGYHVVLIADSTSRWAEALREVAARTGELPAEEGYPARLASALAAFYERSGRVRTRSGAEGSVTILGAVSPPSGDMTEPVSSHTRRFVRCTWSLDADLAYARHYPAVSWTDSWSRDAEVVAEAHALDGDPGWGSRRAQTAQLLADSARLESVAELVGIGSLPDRERVLLLTGRLVREALLQQSSSSPNDAHCAPEKQRALMEMVLEIHRALLECVDRGVHAARIEALDLSRLVRIRDEAGPDDAAAVRAASAEALREIGGLA
jgi:V/A-type H+/Na+-transporting ATPase subunit A